MKIGIIGGGIIGTTIAATLQKHFENVSPSSGFDNSDITIIDDSFSRKHQTSQAGQGYLWSIHRTNDDLSQSFKAKKAWFELLQCSKNNNECDDAILQRSNADSSIIDTLFDPAQRGSLLIAVTDNQKQQLQRHYERSPVGKNGSKEMIYLSSIFSFVKENLPWDSEFAKKILQPHASAIYYPHDYTCTPTQIMKYLLHKHNRIRVDHRSVISLEKERELYDIIICCTGPWIKELYPEADVTPVRGLLVTFEKQHHHQHTNTINDEENNTKLQNRMRLPPMMEIGYGSMGYHFTLSSRTSSNENLWLLGASREMVGFDRSSEHTDLVVKDLIQHSKQFVQSDNIFGSVKETKIGFRASPNHPNQERKSTYTVEKREENLIFSYGFEGQGVLYAALAAKEVLSLVINS